MVVCRFFQQGTCRYGDSCRFEHPRDSNVSPMLRGRQGNQYQYVNPQQSSNTFGGFNNNSNNTNNNTVSSTTSSNSNTQFLAELFKAIKDDITFAEMGGVWPLSCFNPLPSRLHVNVPDFDDHSPEEIRLQQYISRQDGTAQICNDQIQQLFLRVRSKRNEFKNLTPEIVAILDRMLNAPKYSQQFFSQSNNSIVQDAWPVNGEQPGAFGTGSVVAPSFGNSTQQPTSIFGGPPSPTSVFGASSTQQSGAPLFGSSTQPAYSSPSIFGGNSQPSQPLFNSSATNQNFSGQSIFGGVGSFTNPNPPGSIFGGSSAPSGAPQAASNFSFALSNNNFGSAVPSTAPQEAFAGSNSNPNIFGSVAPQQIASGNANAFSGSNQTTANIFAPVANDTNKNASVYSDMNELTEDEKKEYLAATFSDHIPMRPPPKEIC